ncbi:MULTISPECIES: lipocalin family protein [unclassified Capnocytophaga]|jgi:hypothetical protein|uniref:lipocalin family protein n=1 Tax=unclassified Capnocytophaga TaxID=2640652 RepID=UPI000202F0F1|nr:MULTISPECIES: lipocalin family protein [unclassified Capnocytophaga]EGD35428.1 hypothetical protein HMPREF9071_0024 [Capnocytophaga sp. oral taxon 338 str. F0234]MEB3005842.1 lipocalin family protein [Capnocytophaga sp. G2]
MKRLTFVFAFCTFTLGFSQNIIGERWKIDHLIGNSEEEVDVYELSEMPKGKSAGYYVEFKNNNTFHSSYYAPCGNDCFTSTTGTYKKVGNHYLNIFVYRLTQNGECKDNKLLNKSLGNYYIYFSPTGVIRLIKSTGNLSRDREKAQDSERLNNFSSFMEDKITHQSHFSLIENLETPIKIVTQKYAKEILKLTDYIVCLNSTTPSDWRVILIKDNATGKYYYVIEEYISVKGEVKKALFHFSEDQVSGSKK